MNLTIEELRELIHQIGELHFTWSDNARYEKDKKLRAQYKAKADLYGSILEKAIEELDRLRNTEGK